MPRSESPFRIAGFYLQRRDGRPNWYVAWADKRTGQTRRKSTGTSDIEQAKIVLAKYATLNEVVEQQPPSAVRVCDLLLRYYDKQIKGKPSDVATASRIKKLCEYLGNISVSGLSIPIQEAYVDSLKEQGCSDGYIRQIFNTLNAGLNWGEKTGQLSHKPYIQLPSKGHSENKARKLSAQEMGALLFAAGEHSERMKLFMLIALNTAARPTAILELKTDQIDFEKRVLHLNPIGRPQNKKRRPSVPIADNLLPVLREAVVRSASGYLVEYKGRPMKGVKAFPKIVKASGIDSDHVSPYSIRHTVAQHLRNSEISQWEVSGFIGHTKHSITEVYAEYDPNHRGKVVQVIDAYIREIQTSGQKGSCISSNSPAVRGL